MVVNDDLNVDIEGDIDLSGKSLVKKNKIQEVVMDRAGIEEWLKKYKVENYTINEDNLL